MIRGAGTHYDEPCCRNVTESAGGYWCGSPRLKFVRLSESARRSSTHDLIGRSCFHCLNFRIRAPSGPPGAGLKTLWVGRRGWFCGGRYQRVWRTKSSVSRAGLRPYRGGWYPSTPQDGTDGLSSCAEGVARSWSVPLHNVGAVG